MMRIWGMVFLPLATMGASPLRSLPVPPIPPPHPPADQSAPVSDRDATGPLSPASPGPRVTLQDFRADRLQQGFGYTPGSQFETSEDKRPIQTPGLTVQVPLHQGSH
jgi:hypothetical protein